MSLYWRGEHNVQDGQGSHPHEAEESRKTYLFPTRKLLSVNFGNFKTTAFDRQTSLRVTTALPGSAILLDLAIKFVDFSTLEE